MGKLLKHLKTIIKHKHNVFKASIKMGIPLQGLRHDLSKFSPTELKIYKYYTGTTSPHIGYRNEHGFSEPWMHHYHRNKHHFEYWVDMSGSKIVPIKIPFKYIIEAVCDMIGANKAYNGKNFKSSMPLDYWNKNDINAPVHRESLILITFLIYQLASLEEKEFYRWYKENKRVLKRKYEDSSLENWDDVYFSFFKTVNPEVFRHKKYWVANNYYNHYIKADTAHK